jgi:hypothetical protein
VQRGGVRSHEQWVESGEVAEESRRKGGMTCDPWCLVRSIYEIQCVGRHPPSTYTVDALNLFYMLQILIVHVTLTLAVFCIIFIRVSEKI